MGDGANTQMSFSDFEREAIRILCTEFNHRTRGRAIDLSVRADIEIMIERAFREGQIFENRIHPGGGKLRAARERILIMLDTNAEAEYHAEGDGEPLPLPSGEAIEPGGGGRRVGL